MTRAAALERAIAEREGLPPAARALAEEGAALAISLVDVPEGRERAVAAAVGDPPSSPRRRKQACGCSSRRVNGGSAT